MNQIMTSTLTQTKPQFLTEALIEVLNNQWKVNAIESNRSVYHQLEVEEGRKYLSETADRTKDKEPWVGLR